MSIWRTVLACVFAVSALAAPAPSAKELAKQAQKAERDGDDVRAYLLYSQAAALDPTDTSYWARARTLRTRAALKAKPLPKITVQPDFATSAAEEPPPPGFSTEITDEDLAELRRLRPPPELKPSSARRTLDIRQNSKALYEQLARMWGLETIFDADYQPGPSLHFSLENASFQEAVDALNAASGSFIVPLGEKLFFIAKDTQQKRAEAEPTVAITIPLLDTVTPQEVQEIGRGVQQALDVLKIAVDPSRRMVLIKDRISKVRPAQAVFEQLAVGRPQVILEVEFLEANRTSLLSYGLLLPSEFPISYVARAGVKGAVQSLAGLFFGHTTLGLGIADARMFARMSDSSGKTLLSSTLRGADGQPLTLHVGDKFPVATGTLMGATIAGYMPSFNYEDLGLSLKLTPHVHGMDEISIELEAEFKVLGGQSLNGIPVIANRKMQSTVRLKDGQWAVVAGMMSTTEARSISGLPGLSQIPGLGRLFRQNDRDRAATEVVLLIKPRLATLPPTEILTRGIWVGSEGRMRIPL